MSAPMMMTQNAVFQAIRRCHDTLGDLTPDEAMTVITYLMASVVYYADVELTEIVPEFNGHVATLYNEIATLYNGIGGAS